jgi:hypothetical protein
MFMQLESSCALQTMNREPPLPHCYIHLNLVVCTDLQPFAPSPRLGTKAPLCLFHRSEVTLSYAGSRDTSPLKGSWARPHRSATSSQAAYRCIFRQRERQRYTVSEITLRLPSYNSQRDRILGGSTAQTLRPSRPPRRRLQLQLSSPSTNPPPRLRPIADYRNPTYYAHSSTLHCGPHLLPLNLAGQGVPPPS